MTALAELWERAGDSRYRLNDVWSIRDVGDGELRCRDLGHAWDSYRKHGQRSPLFGERRTNLCTSCGGMRHEIVNTWGDIDPSTRFYEMTDEYDFACQFSRQECRVERLRRERRTTMASVAS